MLDQTLFPSVPLFEAFRSFMRDVAVERLLRQHPEPLLGTIVAKDGHEVEVVAEGGIFAFRTVSEGRNVGDTVAFKRHGHSFKIS